MSNYNITVAEHARTTRDRVLRSLPELRLTLRNGDTVEGEFQSVGVTRGEGSPWPLSGTITLRTLPSDLLVIPIEDVIGVYQLTPPAE